LITILIHMAENQIRQQTVVGQVMNEIRELISSGAYGPGDKIPTEKELAERFGIGRSSIREAIKIFNYLGVLESKAALGTFVQERSNISTEAITWSLLLGKDELDEIIDLRASIELWCIRKLTLGYASGEEWAKAAVLELNSIVSDMDEALINRSRESLVEDDFRFHRTIIGSSGTPLFISIYETLRAFLREEMTKSQQDYDDPMQILEEHKEIRDSISGGNPDEAIRTHVAHIENIKIRTKKN
jgi:GntR family transcriptional repressor for pyruvate dehydrogenase complex